MKKRLVTVLVMVVVMVAGCENSNSVEEPIGADSQMTENEIDTDVPSLLDGVTMEVTEYSDTRVTVRITNDTDMNIRCGSDFHLKILDEESEITQIMRLQQSLIFQWKKQNIRMPGLQ